MIFNIGGAAFKPPVLNPNYPADVSVVQSSSASATFQVVIEEAGEPAEYTYQWYVNNSAVSGATTTTYTKTGLTTVATYIVYCKVTHAAGVVTSRSATLSVESSTPEYTFSGTQEFINDGNNNWRIKLKSSGALNFSRLGNAASGIDIFCVGGGGGGGCQGGGGGGGRTTTSKNRSISANTKYTVVIGAGGAGGPGGGGGSSGGSGGTTSISGTGLSVSATGGDGGQYAGGGHGKGGNGGSGGGTGTQYQQVNGSAGGSDGGDGKGTNPGTGQHTTTREFGQTGATLYAGGGGGSYTSGGAGGGGAGSDFNGNASSGATNTGGGGGGSGGASSAGSGGSGGSGIIVIRNKR